MVRLGFRVTASSPTFRASPPGTPLFARSMPCGSSRGLDFGFEVDIVKGIPLGSGMGGSAASAVAALVAANALLGVPLRASDLYPIALEGEAAASGGRHGDNVGPMLLGGLVLATADRLIRLPVPKGLTCVLVHPHLVLETRKAREALAHAVRDLGLRAAKRRVSRS